MKFQSSSSSHPQESEQTLLSPYAKETFQKVALNALIVAALSILVNLCLRADFIFLHNTLGETSFTESAQLLMLAITIGSFYHLASIKGETNYAAVLIAGFFSVLMLREMDVWFDMIAHGSWVVPAIAVTATACYIAYKGGNQTIEQMAQLLNTRYMPILVTGLVILLVFTRLYGMGSFWHAVMGDHYMREIKNLSEEATELMAYSIIAFAAFKTNRLVKRSATQDQVNDLTESK